MPTVPNSPFAPFHSEELSLEVTYPHKELPFLNIVPFHKVQMKKPRLFELVKKLVKNAFNLQKVLGFQQNSYK